MHFSVQKKIRFGFFIAFTVIVAASIFSYLVAKNLLDNADRLNHAIEVSKILELVTSQLKKAEAGHRKYHLTKDSTYLSPSIQERISQIEKKYRVLRQITADNPLQQRNLDTLQSLLAVIYKQLQTGRQKSTEETHSIKEVERAMDRIDNKVRDMIRVEENLVQEKFELFNFFSVMWIPVIFISSLIAILIGIYSYVILTREFKLQLRIESRMKSYQRDLQQNINLLNKSNQELEQFAYVASHDLQEPLRKISTFSDRLQIKYREQLPTDAQQLIDRMVLAVSRMRILINDLLMFSRAGRITPESIRQVDMDKLLQEILADLEETLEEKNVTVTYDHLPVIEGSDTSFHQLFQNLLANAIKFASPDRHLEINIHHQILSGKQLGIMKESHWNEMFCRISLEDNGIGFDQAYADRIFLIFQRLHGISEYSGTGIGLAICKKIVDSHNGFIQAYGQPNKGATFVVILPIKQMFKDAAHDS